MIFKKFALYLFLFLSGPVFSQTSTAAVNVHSQCDADSVGSRVSYFVRESIRKSSAYRLVEQYSKAGFQISLVCLPKLDSSDSGVVSSFSYNFVLLNFRNKGYYDYHLNHGVYRCGTNRVESCAQEIVASFDKIVVDLRARISSGDFEPF